MTDAAERLRSWTHIGGPSPAEEPYRFLNDVKAALAQARAAGAADAFDVRKIQAALHSTLSDDSEPHVRGEEPLCEYIAIYLTDSLKDPEIVAMHEKRLAEANQ